MTVLHSVDIDALRTYATADLDDPRTRANVTDLVLRMLPDFVDTVEYWTDLAMERLDGIDHDTAWPLCRCERDLTCHGCGAVASECDCSSVTDEIAAAADDEDLSDLDPLTRTLMGLPSGIRCGTTGRPA